MAIEDLAGIAHRIQDRFIKSDLLPRFLRNTPQVATSSGPAKNVDEPSKEDEGIRVEESGHEHPSEATLIPQIPEERHPGEPAAVIEGVVYEEQPAGDLETQEYPPQPMEGQEGSDEMSQYNDAVTEEDVFAAEQALRQQKYVEFMPEELEEDYTGGPCRYIVAHDGVKESASLLVPCDMSQKIKHAVRMQRRYAKIESQITEQLRELRRWRFTLQREIGNHKFKIRGDADYDEKPDETEAAKLQGELEILQDMEEYIKPQEDELKMKLDWQAELLREANAAVLVYLEDAYVVGVLLEEDSNEELPVERFDLREQYQKHHAKRRKLNDDDDATTPPPPLDTSRNTLMHRPPTPTPEEQFIQERRQQLRAAGDRLNIAQKEFHFKEYNQWQEKEFNRARVHEGLEPIDVDKEAFDKRWFVRNHEITHELVEAEDDLRSARKAAIEADVDIISVAPDEYWSGIYPNHVSDGRCGSGSDLSSKAGPRVPSTSANPKVLEWLEGGAEASEFETPDQSPNEPEEVFVLNDTMAMEIETWDSQSMLDSWPYRRKLVKQWQQTCSAEREQLAV
ncbi:hypothetical protein CKM354_000419400 [Cercospora kikuchii]|uniref:Uncharacterized protein n=1 Tax=Cercospora kikuchii TaxID=84275 RepID=A0A9P3CLX9_9PEZI|nr:uncharacterized protein CKM354_000419400 [Cercospora kikuchii]GIZ40873.1 hypothetical protein CKM354_000419400 [Cercospora kikuchii]